MVKPTTKETKYEPVPLWAKVPHPMKFKEATAVAVDSKDRVYVFNRGVDPVIVFDKEGNFVETWGRGEFDRPHGISFDAADNMYLADDLAHMIEKRDSSGKLMLRIGERGKAAKWQGGDPFNRPTHVAIHPQSGDLFITDGYGNSRVHRYDKTGKHLNSWGRPGTGHGEFSLPHNICMLGNDHVVVCDRENFRLQIFTLDGKFVRQVHSHRPIAIAAGRGEDTNIYVAEAGPPPVQEGVPGLGRRVVVYDREFNVVTTLGAGVLGEEPERFIAPHGIGIDSEGSVYVAEVSYTAFGSQQEPPREVASLRKWRRASG